MGEDPSLSLSPRSAAAADGRLYPGRPLLAASLAVFRGDRVLLAKRAAEPLAGLFTLPGGLVEPGEALAEAALREMKEEVGVEARIVAFNRHVEVILRDARDAVARHYVIASFVGEWIAGEGEIGPEASAILWVTRDEIADLPMTDQLPEILGAAWAIRAASAA